ncbi:hypothetical protein [Fundidesulfovibrio agrisoli]|uniref:hypothetical protein n=1 Tax=Fundidesulfovibrio agrisoli TaxID=2922717 RepID=UPI001FABBDDD|nr:hypothetical protein [Fundidesulfovibrio agrisoli]
MRQIIFALMFLLATAPASAADLTAKADQLLGIPYRPDGVRDPSGRWTTFEHPEQAFAAPGLNCSGLDYTLMRLLGATTVDPRQAARDRLGDSGPGAPKGQDWDFGFDIILNLTDQLKRRWLLPQARAVSPADTGEAMRGFPVEDRAAWKAALSQIAPNQAAPSQAALVSFSQPGRRKGYGLQHYHVGLILPDASGGRWLYQATPKSGAHKLNLASPEGMDRFQRFFAGPDRRALLLGVTLP